MLRIAVATYLMLVTVAGPWLCCCSPARLSALFSKPSTETSSAPARPPCCSHHADPCPENDPGSTPAQPQPTRAPCPCQDRPDGSALVSPPLSEETRQILADDSEAPGDLFSLPAFHHELVLGFRLPVARAPDALPFLTTDDILHALHILRC